MFGCDKFCTYCVVPMTRGPEQSRPPADILQETLRLADQGVREITLLGQTVNSYKFADGGRTWRLGDLLASIHDVAGIERIKFVTNFPRDMSDDLLRAMRDLPKVARYLHVPLQSGCDEVLKRMKRGYSTGEYRDMMDRIRETLPGCAVSSDFIVGFCGESEESFQRTMDSVREYRFKNSFIFKYSPRPGTKAFELYADDVPEEVKRRRNNELLDLQTEISDEDNAQFIGRTVEVLVEGPSKRAQKAAELELPGWHAGAETGGDSAASPSANPPGVGGLVTLEGLDRESANRAAGETPAAPPSSKIQLVGRTSCDRIVVFDGNPRLAGTLAQIAIADCTPTTLLGSIVTRHVQPGSSGLLPILV
jgi:tRNA-2-methylthio-N6-dimethylallyladenosine synthase